MKMEHPYTHILTPSSTSATVTGVQQSLDTAHPPVDLSITDLPTGSTADASRKRTASRIKSSYPRKRAIQACQKCRVRRTKCDNLRPSCSSCLDLGVECNYSERDPSSFDAASLAILEKLSTIEQLLSRDDRGDRPRLPAASALSSDPAESPVSHVKSSHSPSLERTREAAPLHMSIERILSWRVFQDLSPRLDLRHLLNASNDSQSRQTMTADDFDQHWDEQLVKNFMNEVYIFNPVVEEAKIQQYVRDARFRGIGNDGPACLLVLDAQVLDSVTFELTLLATHSCPWSPIRPVKPETASRCFRSPSATWFQTSRVVLQCSTEQDGRLAEPQRCH